MDAAIRFSLLPWGFHDLHGSCAVMIQLQFWLGGYDAGYRGVAMDPPASSAITVAPQAVQKRQRNELLNLNLSRSE